MPNADRVALVRRGLLLNYATIAYNVIEAVVSLVAGIVAGSVALVGFGFDSVIEVTASGAAQWRLRVDDDHARRDRVERTTRRVIGWSFVALAVYVTVDGVMTLWNRERPDGSAMGVAILTLSVVVMPVLAYFSQQITDARSLQRATVATVNGKRVQGAWYF